MSGPLYHRTARKHKPIFMPTVRFSLWSDIRAGFIQKAFEKTKTKNPKFENCGNRHQDTEGFFHNLRRSSREKYQEWQISHIWKEEIQTMESPDHAKSARKQRNGNFSEILGEKLSDSNGAKQAIPIVEQ